MARCGVLQVRVAGRGGDAASPTCHPRDLQLADPQGDQAGAGVVAEEDLKGCRVWPAAIGVVESERVLQRDGSESGTFVQRGLAAFKSARPFAVQANHRHEPQSHRAALEELGGAGAGRLFECDEYGAVAGGVGAEEVAALESALVLAYFGPGHRAFGGDEQGDGGGE